MTDREVMQQALEALFLPTMKTQQMLIQRDEAIIALRRALEQPTVKESLTVKHPVAWAIYDRRGGSKSLHWHESHTPDGDATKFDAVPLYTTPPAAQRKPLTIKEINALPEAKGYWPIGMNDRIVRLIRAVEAAHGIKEGT